MCQVWLISVGGLHFSEGKIGVRNVESGGRRVSVKKEEEKLLSGFNL